jgi:hypothetical protein
MGPSPQSRVADPVEGEEGAFEPSYFPKRLRKRILLRVCPASLALAAMTWV